MPNKEIVVEDDDIDDGLSFSQEHLPRALDGGWGWVIVFASLIFNTIYDGCSYSFGLLYTNLLDYFGDTKSNTAWIGSLFFSVPLLCGPFAAFISNKLGYRKSTMLGGFLVSLGFGFSSFATSTGTLIFFYGLVAGIGISIPYFNSTVMIANYFDKKRSLAMGIAECGAGVGTLIFAPLTQYLISTYGWRGTLLILSGVVGNIMVCGALFRPLEQSKETMKTKLIIQNGAFKGDDLYEDSFKENSKNDDPSLSENGSLTMLEEGNQNGVTLLEGKEEDTQVKTKIRIYGERAQRYCSSLLQMISLTFVTFLFLNFTMYFWYDVPYVFLVDKTVSEGTPSIKAAFLISTIGFVHTFGVVLYGFLGDRTCINNTVLFGISIFCCGASMFFVPLTNDYPLLALLAAGFGMFSASTEVLVPVILIELVGIKNFGKAYGLVLFLEGIANLVGPPVAGKSIYSRNVNIYIYLKAIKRNYCCFLEQDTFSSSFINGWLYVRIQA